MGRQDQRCSPRMQPASGGLNFAARFAFVYCKMRTKSNHAQVLIWATLPESEE